MVGTIGDSAGHVGKIVACIPQRNLSGFADSFSTVAIAGYGHGEDGFLYACNFGVMAS